MIKLHHRYLAYYFMAPFLLGTLLLTIFLLTFEIFRILDILVRKGMEWSTALTLMGNICISFVPLVVPFAGLVASYYALNRLSEESEIIALQTFGISIKSIVAPFMMIAVFLAFTLFGLSEGYIPSSKKISRNLVIRLAANRLVGDIRPESFFTEIPNGVLFVNKVFDGGRAWENVFFHINPRDHNNNKNFGYNTEPIERVIMAKRGYLLHPEENGTKGMTIQFEEGNMLISNPQKKTVEKINFNEYGLPLNPIGPSVETIHQKDMMNGGELYDLMKSLQKDVKEGEAKGITIENPGFKETKASMIRAELEWWSRLNFPLECLAFILLGVGLGIRNSRHQSRHSLGLGLLIVAGYYTLFFFGIGQAKRNFFPSSFAILFPTFVIFFIGWKFYKKLEWVSG